MRKEKNTIKEEQFEEDAYLGICCLPIEIVDLDIEEDFIELNVYQDVYKEGKTPEDYVLVKKDVISKQTIYKNEITHIKQVVNKQGNNRITRVQLGLRSGDTIVAVGSYNKLRDALFSRTKKEIKPVGFKFY